MIGGARHLELAAPITAESRIWPSPIGTAYPEILAWRGRGRVCVLATGDPFHYGIGSELARLLSPSDWVCYPQPSAFSLAAARLGWSLPDCALVSVHGRAIERVIPHLHPGARLIVLSASGETPKRLAELLCKRGFGGASLTVLERMGGERECVRAFPATGQAPDEIDGINTVAIVCPADPHLRSIALSPGLPDEWFANDGQLTRAEMRAITLAALAPRPGDMLWDIGAGSGSIGIEWCLRHPANRAIAIEARPDRAERITLNARELGVIDRITLITGRAPDALEGLPEPQAVFIGGGATNPALFERAWEALASGGRLVINAVTLETEASLAAYHARHGGLMRRVALSHLEKIGGFHGWRPAMPLTQWAVVKP